jgi:Ni,Fe-hydrogenase III large subunit
MHDYVMPYGPQHPSLKEPLNLALELDGDHITGVHLRLGYVHRGVEKIFEGKDVQKVLYLAEHTCGICSYAHSSACTRAMEQILGLEAPPRARLLRTIVAELERLHSHLLWAGFAMHEIGFQSLFMLFWRERERVLDALEDITGGRVHHNYNKLGSVRYDLPKGAEKKVAEKLDELEANLPDLDREMKKNNVVRARLKRVGHVSKHDALGYGLVGPMARGSGVDCDIRKSDPYAAYAEVKFKEVIEKDGDAFARAKVRLAELRESISIIRQCLTLLPEKRIAKWAWPPIKSGRGFGRVEAPRGEDFHYYEVKNNIVTRGKIRTPTLANIGILEKLLVGSEMGDTPVIVSSFDPCIGCLERTLVIDNGKREWVSEQEFRRKYCD